MPADTNKRRTAVDAVIGFLFTLLLLCGAEFAARRWEREHIRFQHDPWETMDPELGVGLRAGYSEDGIHINALGFRGPETTREKPAGVFRIATIGDSTAFARGNNIPYPEVLQQRLDSSRSPLCPSHYEVINAGIEGHASRYALARLRRDVIPMEPDLITIYIGWNDLYSTDPEGQVAVNQSSTYDEILSRSALLRSMTRFIYQNIQPQTESVTPDRIALYKQFDPVSYKQNLRAMIELSRENNAGIVLITLPSVLGDDHAEDYEDIILYPPFTARIDLLTILWQQYNLAIQQVGEEENVPVIDLAAAYMALDDEGEMFIDALHYEQRGYDFTASVLASALISNTLLPCEHTHGND